MAIEPSVAAAPAQERPARDEELAGPVLVAPVADEERISSVDVLRGVALLGILLMNVLDFGMAWRGPETGLTPATGGNWADLAFGAVSHVLFEGKMRGLFSLLFGAGVILLTSRVEGRGGGAYVADIYYRRNLWLIAFGLIHAYFIWAGDILFDYGLTGLFLFPFRKARPAALIAAGVFLLAVVMVKGEWNSRDLLATREKAFAADRAAAAGKPLTEEQREDQKKWEERLKEYKPSPEKVAKSIAAHRAGYAAMFAHRAEEVASGQPVQYYRWGFFDVGGMMLIGMALMKLSVLSARKSYRFYAAMMAFGYGIGVPLNATTGYKVWASGFDMFMTQRLEFWYSPGRLSVTLGHVGLILTLFKLGFAPGLMARLAAVGRMALTNYLATSIVCTLVFNGYGLGLYDRSHRYQLLGVALAVWAVQLALSPVWLRHYRYGPMEWLWRSLTYWERQPMRKAIPASS
jgi:uncharacterized protein